MQSKNDKFLIYSIELGLSMHVLYQETNSVSLLSYSSSLCHFFLFNVLKCDVKRKCIIIILFNFVSSRLQGYFFVNNTFAAKIPNSI